MKRRAALSFMAASLAVLAFPRTARAGTWPDWTKLMMGVPRVRGAGIYTHWGLVCDETGLSFGRADITELQKSFTTTFVVLGGAQHRRMTGNDEMVLLRGGDVPVVLYKTRRLYMVAKGEPDASAPTIASDMRWIYERLRPH